MTLELFRDFADSERRRDAARDRWLLLVDEYGYDHAFTRQAWRVWQAERSRHSALIGRRSA
jgi:hypothetical protein